MGAETASEEHEFLFNHRGEREMCICAEVGVKGWTDNTELTFHSKLNLAQTVYCLPNVILLSCVVFNYFQICSVTC